MMQALEKYIGIHPGIVLERELKKRAIPKSPFAISLGEYPQTLVAVTKGKRRMNPSLSLKIEKALKMEEGFLLVLQAYHDIKIEKQKSQHQKPDLSLFREALFWDTDINKINWIQQKEAVIKRVFERGNEQEKKEIKRFYGLDEK